MLKQHFIIPKYDWKVDVYYYVTCYYLNEILTKLRSMGCNDDMLEDAYRNMSSCKLNTGLTYSNSKNRYSLIVISTTSEPAQFMNSLFHEHYHLISHIEERFSINPFSEEAAYLAGFVAQRMYPKAKRFLCKCHFTNVLLKYKTKRSRIERTMISRFYFE